MTVNIKPSIARGEIAAPPSKSVAHRALICAALSAGSRVTNIDLSEDIKATLEGLQALGAKADINGKSAFIGGINKAAIPAAKIECGASGSTLRFLIPLAMAGGNKTVFCGEKRLFMRDLSVYESIAERAGISFNKGDTSLTVCGKLKAGKFCVRGDISSQFVTGLMLALPLLSGDSVIEFTSPVFSKPYIDITVGMLSRFGISVIPRENGYLIPGNQTYKPSEIEVEGDYSNAAFLDAFNLFGGNVKVLNLNADTAQGDRVYKRYFGDIRSGGSYDLSDCPDLAPVMLALASEFSGAVFTGTSRLKIKESDRAAAMAEELRKFGGELTVKDDTVGVKALKLHAPRETLCSHNDHRIVMALAVLASRYGGEISGAEAVNKSYPGFFEDIKKLGIEVEIK